MLARILTPLFLLTPALAQATFQSLGPGTRASGISPDGQYVYGTGGAGTFRWDLTNGLQYVVPMGLTGGSVQGSADGQHGCGGYTNPGSGNQEAARWDMQGNVQWLGGLASQSGTSLSSAYAIDDAGTTIVGLGWATPGTAHAFKWTLAGGMVDLGASPGGYSSRANGISPDGSVVLGWDWGSPRHPVYWAGGTMHQIGNGILEGESWASSTNGSVITGSFGLELFRWTQPGGMVQLGKLPGSVAADRATGLDISADGSVIVGTNGGPLGTPFRALLWRADIGLVDLKDYFVTHGLPQVAGWYLQSATAISADGTVIAGYGFNPNNQVEAWIASTTSWAFTNFCSPGFGGVVGCPCSNPPSGTGVGCDNSSATGGASLTAGGAAMLSADTLSFVTAGELPLVTSILLSGTAASSGVAYGQGVRCVDGSLKRLYIQAASGGSVTMPGVGEPTVSAQHALLADPIGAGDHRYYMVYYRDPIVLGGCNPTLTFNGTDAVDVTWAQ